MMQTIKTKLSDRGDSSNAEGPTKKEVRALERRIEAQAKARRYFLPGRLYTCDVCGKRSFEGSDDVSLQVLRRGIVYVFHHLHGAVCRDCGATTVEPSEMLEIDDRLFTGRRTTFQAAVTNVGKGAVGTYWPRDVQRLLGLEGRRRLEIEVLSPDLALVRVLPQDAPREAT